MQSVLPRLAWLVLAGAGCCMAREAVDRPNIVMFFVDDLGYGDLGFTGHPTTHTPTFDKLAFNGKVLTSWYSGCPVCSGSRAALMTGRQYVRTVVSSSIVAITAWTCSIVAPLTSITCRVCQEYSVRL
jgi:hypothetical protein